VIRTLAALGLLTSCSTTVSLGEECDHSGECGTERVCVAGICRDACLATYECGAYEECTEGACLPCDPSCTTPGDSNSGDPTAGDPVVAGDPAVGDPGAGDPATGDPGPGDPGPCICTWHADSCGDGGCSSSRVYRYQTCDPPGCATPQTQCQFSEGCCSCSWGIWVAGAGCGGTCACDEQRRWWTCNSSSCSAHNDQRCLFRSTCVPNCP